MLTSLLLTPRLRGLIENGIRLSVGGSLNLVRRYRNHNGARFIAVWQRQ